jgi:RecA-family ATPase
VPKQYNLLALLEYIDPSNLDYQEWCNVGMALKEAGYTAADFDKWSQRDPARYHKGEAFRKWDSFKGSGITGGTIVAMARDGGWQPERESRELDWDAEIGGKDDYVIIQDGWLEGREVTEPETWDPVEHLVKYLETLFEAGENVGYVTTAWYDNEKQKWFPTKGNWDRTAGQLIEELRKCNGDIGSVLGDYKPEVGAWIRFNPLDGEGCKNENVTDFRYALVESDAMDLDKQNAIIRELELPVACLVHSGKKSIHAIVRIDAPNYEEYRKRVDYLYNVLKKNGMPVDTQNKNPSRLSRMPGVMRNGRKQFLIDTNIGKESWAEWYEWIEGVNDDLPEPESLAEVWDNLPPLAPTLIDGVLRQGHKMLLAGPSKAGKSFLLIYLCCAIAEGREWLAWQCAQGKILYVNLELDRASCLHRFKDVYASLGWSPANINNIDIWGLRGKSIPMDKLAPKLIRRAQKKNYIAIVIDPIYKVITGDENSADQMAHFCNQFDKVCTELGCAVIYCHHHSKGTQGQKRSMDRASGSGVFARDPDALLDMIELDLSETLIKQEKNKAACNACTMYLDRNVPGWDDAISQDDTCSERAMLAACERICDEKQYQEVLQLVHEAKKAVESRTAWRISGTLREFPKFPPVNLWFSYPIHNIDTVGVLQDAYEEGEAPPYHKATERHKESAKRARADKRLEFENAVMAANMGDPPTKQQLAEYLGISERTVQRRITEHGGYYVEDNLVLKKNNE